MVWDVSDIALLILYARRAATLVISSVLFFSFITLRKGALETIGTAKSV